MPVTAPRARPGPDAPYARRARLRHWWRRRVLAHRRLLAFCCVVAAALATLDTLAPDTPHTELVRVAARDLTSGTVIQADDLVWSPHAPDTAPDGLIDDPIGTTLAAPMRRGEPVTDARVLTPALLDGYPGLVATAVRVSDPVTVDLLRVGDTVDLVSADPRAGRATTVATRARVVALPHEPAAVSGREGVGSVVVMAMDPHEVEAVTVSGVREYVTVVWSR